MPNTLVRRRRSRASFCPTTRRGTARTGLPHVPGSETKPPRTGPTLVRAFLKRRARTACGQHRSAGRGCCCRLPGAQHHSVGRPNVRRFGREVRSQKRPHAGSQYRSTLLTRSLGAALALDVVAVPIDVRDIDAPVLAQLEYTDPQQLIGHRLAVTKPIPLSKATRAPQLRSSASASSSLSVAQAEPRSGIRLPVRSLGPMTSEGAPDRGT